ncbi:MAG: MNIO family bufferin maturase [Myxococcales bacterium]
MPFERRFIGHGVGLRTRHFAELVGPGSSASQAAGVDWFEAISENFMIPGGRPLAVLERVRQDFPVVLHGVSLSIGSTDPLDRRYLRELRALADRIEPAWMSDHLCWGSVGGRHAHDLLPLPLTEESLRLTVERVGRVQEALGRPFLLENVSSYLTFRQDVIPEWEFLAEVAKRADCGILLDVNNVYVSAHNHGFSAETYLAALPPSRIGQIHLAGHRNLGTHLFDSHDGRVIEPVWRLFRSAVRRFGRVSTLIEWDERIPPFSLLAAESAKAARETAEVLDARRPLA